MFLLESKKFLDSVECSSSVEFVCSAGNCKTWPSRLELIIIPIRGDDCRAQTFKLAQVASREILAVGQPLEEPASEIGQLMLAGSGCQSIHRALEWLFILHSCNTPAISSPGASLTTGRPIERRRPTNRELFISLSRCNTLTNCSVIVSKELFGDPCEGTSKVSPSLVVLFKL